MRLLFLAQHPFDRHAGVERGRVVDRNDVRPDIDSEYQFGAAEHDCLHLLLGEIGNQRLQLALAVADDPACGQLFENDSVDFADPAWLDRREADAARFEPAADVRLGHGEARAKQGNPGAAVGGEPVRGGVAYVQYGNSHIRGHGVVGLVDGVAGDDQAFRSTALQPLGGIDHDLCDPVPVTGELHRRNLGKIDAFDGKRGAVKTAEALRDAAIDMLVIERGRRPAHAPDDAQLAQPFAPSRCRRNGIAPINRRFQPSAV